MVGRALLEEGDDAQSASRGLRKIGEVAQPIALLPRELNAVRLDQRAEAPAAWAATLAAACRAEHEGKHPLSTPPDVQKLPVDADGDRSALGLTLQYGAGLEEIEEQPPAGDLGKAIRR